MPAGRWLPVVADEPSSGASKDITLAPVRSAVAGTVTSVRLLDNFVVIDFGKNAVPPKGMELTAYRGGKKVARLRMSEPCYPLFGPAILLEGLPEIGDSVH